MNGADWFSTIEVIKEIYIYFFLIFRKLLLTIYLFVLFNTDINSLQ